MINAENIFNFLQEWAPCETAMDFDNVGLLVHSYGQTTGVLCALDITTQVVKEAIEKNCNVIVSHHPVIFGGIKRISQNDVVAQLIKNDISAVCMHTNLDLAIGGVNDVLADILNVKNVKEFTVGRKGDVETTTVKELANLCAEKLGEAVQFVNADKSIEKIAIIGGSGGDCIMQAKQEGIDCLITGEAKHHEYLYAQHENIGLIVAGHHATEVVIVPEIANRLKQNFNGLNIIVSKTGNNPYQTIVR